MRIRKPTVSLLAPESRTSDSHPAGRADVILDAPVPRKRTKKQSKGASSASVPPPRVTAVASAPSAPMPTASSVPPACSISGGLPDSAGEHSDLTSHLPASRKRTKKPTERSEYARVHQAKPKRTQGSTERLSMTYHVRNGQIVTLASEPGPPSQVPATSSVSLPEEADQDTQTPDRIRHRKGQENQAIKTPLSSPAKPSHPSPRSVRFVNSSPTKQDAWDAISRRARTWPELPSVFSHWDAQVCFSRRFSTSSQPFSSSSLFSVTSECSPKLPCNVADRCVVDTVATSGTITDVSPSSLAIQDSLPASCSYARHASASPFHRYI